MSLLSYNRLVQLVEQGVITDVKPEQINSTSIDITLGDTVLFEEKPQLEENGYISLKSRNPLVVMEQHEGDVFIKPGQFILAQSQQKFYLPNNISAEYKLKSSMARIGLEHLNAGWCDAGWNNSVLTLELKNMTQYHTIMLQKGDLIGQMVFFEHEPVPHERSYATRGRYNGDATVSGVKE
jgi:deoxycytidine triphosphate deaminase